MPSALSRLLHRAVYAFDRTFKTGNRRAEFEHKYGVHGDYFGYLSRPYETAKYARTLEIALAARRARSSALEIGCSVGVFTRMIASEFDEVVAVDIADAALRQARAHVAGLGRVSYHRSDVLALDLGRRFDVVFCAEVLMYVRPERGEDVCAMLARHLVEDGVIIEVVAADRASNAKFFQAWDQILGERFTILRRETVADPERPYEIVVYGRSAAARG